MVQWYLDNIYPELFIPGDAVASGDIGNEWSNQCVDSAAKKEDLHKAVGLWPCHNQGGNQYWMLSKTGEIRLVSGWAKSLKKISCHSKYFFSNHELFFCRRDEACLDYAGSDVILYPCHGSKGDCCVNTCPGIVKMSILYCCNL